MKYKAHDYQQYATDFIIKHPVCCLILDMGLGKTVNVLTVIMSYTEETRINNDNHNPIIVVCSSSL